MTDTAAVNEVLRMWRRLNALGRKTEHATQAIDEANERGFDDRALLKAATLIAGHLLVPLAEARGKSLDETLEVMIREGVTWRP